MKPQLAFFAPNATLLLERTKRKQEENSLFFVRDYCHNILDAESSSCGAVNNGGVEPKTLVYTYERYIKLLDKLFLRENELRRNCQK